MKQLWSVSFFSLTFALLAFPLVQIIHVLIGQTRQLRFLFLSLFLLYSLSVSDWPYPCRAYIRVIRNMHVHTGWRRKTNDISRRVSCKGKLMSIITHLLNKRFFFSFFFALRGRQEIILSENKFDYLIARIYQNRDYRERMAFN